MSKSYTFYENERTQSVAELVEHSVQLYGESVAIKYKKKKVLSSKTYKDVLRDSQKFAKRLLSDLRDAKHIAILGASSYEWIIAYLGIAFANLVVIPLDRKLSTEDLTDLLKQADADCLVFDKEYAEVAGTLLQSTGIKGISMDAMLSEPIPDATLPTIDPDALFEIVFTSGTTGKSKGVMLTQRNIASNVWQGLGAVKVEHNKDVILSVLPFNHAYEITCTILGMFFKGVPICISAGLKYFQKELKEFSPTIMFIVPLIAEKLYMRIERTVKKQNKTRAFHFATALTSFFYKRHIDISSLLLKEVKDAFGGRLRILMCGGAPLDEALVKKFSGIGINLFQGYGLTECSPLLTVNFDYYHRPNSVGKVVKECKVKIVDGEIWATGVSVSKGYYNNPEATKESFEDGWFKTGDLGSIDEDNFVFITGRKKNLIILENGENVSAEELEAIISKLSFVDEVIVHGVDNQIVAEVYINRDEHDISEKEASEKIRAINESLPSYKHINRVHFRLEPFPKTTSQKIKRIY